MTLRRVANLAGVSTSTVSRVLNASPGTAAATADAVKLAVAQTAYTPTRRRRTFPRAAATSVSGRRVGFFIVQQPGGGSVPAYSHLLRGVSQACNNLHLNLQVGFIEAGDDLVQILLRQRFEGLILHGIPPRDKAAEQLHGIPTVWLMGNPRRPNWGDQVMPDNGVIGQLAAQYLFAKHHTQFAYFGINYGWSMSVRSLAFQQAVEDGGGNVTVLNQPGALTGGEPLDAVARRFAQRFVSTHKGRCGVFVAEDWLLRYVYAAVDEAGLRIGSDLDIISCNNDRPYLLGLSPTPATIDIRFERIGFRGVEQLVKRLQSGDQQNRIRIMIEPTLVPPPPVDAPAS